MSRHKSQVARDEGGFTMLELLVAIAITGIIMVTMGFAITESLGNSTLTQGSVDRSVVGSLAGRYFAADIASSLTAPVVSPSVLCGTGGSAKIAIATSATNVVEYVLSPTGTALYRRECTGSLAAGLTFTSQINVGTSRDSFTAASACPTTTTTCTLTLSWSSPPVYSVTVSGTRRVNAS